MVTKDNFKVDFSFEFMCETSTAFRTLEVPRDDMQTFKYMILKSP